MQSDTVMTVPHETEHIFKSTISFVYKDTIKIKFPTGLKFFDLVQHNHAFKGARQATPA